MTDTSTIQNKTVPGYQIRARVLGVHPIIWRRFLVRTDNTFADLHYALQIALDWSDDFLHQFVLQGKTIGVPRIHNNCTHSATVSTLEDFGFKVGQRFLYEYNFFVFWQVEIRIEKRCPLPAKNFYPRCISGKRAGPVENCGGASGFMRLRHHYSPVYTHHWILNLYDLLLEAEEMTEELEWELETRRSEYEELKYWVDVERFERGPVNQRLKLYAEGNEEWRYAVEVG